MNHRTPLHLAILTALCGLFPSLSAQDEELAFVRDWVGYRVVPDFAPNPNNIDVYSRYCLDFQQDPGALGTCQNRSPYGLEADDFLQQLAQAYAEGRGGVINFETPILGPAYRAVDRRGHRAYMEQFMLDNPLEGFEATVRAENPGISDADALGLASTLQKETAYAAAEAALLDPSQVGPVVARSDRSMDDTVDRPINEALLANTVVGFYGPDQDIPLVISRGDKAYTEGQLATFNVPGSWDLNALVNGEFFPSLGISGYSGTNGSAYRPVSGINTFNHGMHDLRFDPRDNVTAIGFVVLNYGNFQYYQGDSGVPNNPNNMRVVLEFANGESEEFAETTGQDTGLWDTFYAFQAPEGTSITRIWVRVKGQNWRTFVALDDLAFITEPALAYVAGEKTFSGSEGAEFYELMRVGQNPDSVTISDLPPGLAYDAETGLIAGTFSAAGLYESTVRLVNPVGTVEETLTFEVAPAGDPSGYLRLDPVDPVNVVLRRSLPQLILTSNLDSVLPPGSIEFFARVEKLLEDGSRIPSSLDFLGLTLRDNLLFGTPGSAQQIGVYEVTVYAREEASAAFTRFPLSILAPTRAPNFDANGTTDFGLLAGGALLAANNEEAPGSFGANPLESRLNGLTASGRVFLGDFNGDIRSDLLHWDAQAGSVRLFLADESGTGFTPRVLLEGVDPASGEQIVAVADFDGDGNSDLLWHNEARARQTVWRLRNGLIAWAGTLEKTGGIGSLLLSADFAGDGSLMQLYRHADGLYQLEQYTTFTSLGAIQAQSLEFTMDPAYRPLLAADFSNDGREDLLWENPETGEVRLWLMEGTEIATSYFVPLPVDEDGEVLPVDGPLEGRPGLPLLPPGFDWSVVTAVDLNNDQFADLVLRNRATGVLGVLFLQVNRSVGNIIQLGGAEHELRGAGDYDGDAVNDLLLENTPTGQLLIRSLEEAGPGTTLDDSVPAGGLWLNAEGIRNSTAPVAVGYDWLGPTTFVSSQWMFVHPWGYLSPVAVDFVEEAGWFYDPTIGYLWTSSAYYPNLYQSRNGFWLYYVEGSRQPRWFYNHIFGFYMSENEL